MIFYFFMQPNIRGTTVSCKESSMAHMVPPQLLFAFSFCLVYKETGEDNGHPLQYSWLENPMDREAREAAVHGVAKNQT